VTRAKDGVERIFKFLPCAISLITGESGSGKSFFAMWCAWQFIRGGGHVFSNVVVAQLQPDGKWDDTKHPERYHFVQSWSEFFTRLSEVMLKEPAGRALLIIDEAASSLSAYEWQGESAKLMRSSATLKRKWLDLHVMVITMRHSLVLKALRETGEEGGLKDITFYKDTWAIEKWGGHLLDQPYDRKEIVVISRDELQEPEAYTFTVAEQLALPTELAKPGDYSYATLGQSTWGLGSHPHAEKGRWSWQHFIAIQSGIWPDRIPQLVYDYWHSDPNKRLIVPVPAVKSTEVVGFESREEKLAKLAQPAKHATTQKGGVVREVERLLIERGYDTNLSAIAREVSPPVTQQFVSQTRKRLRAEGKF